MKDYIVDLKHTEYGFVRVKANNKQEASDKAQDEEMVGNAYWNKSYTEATEVREGK